MRLKPFVAGLILLSSASCVTASPDLDLTITNVTIIDGAGTAPFVGDVLIDQGRIVTVEAAHSSARARDTIDGTGQFLIPGLIDMHVHLASFALHPEGLDALLDAGVTTARDMGGDVRTLTAWRDEIARGARRGPELVIVGATLNGERVAPFHRLVARPEDAPAAVAEMAGAGAIQIKVHNSLAPETFAAIIQASHSRGLDVVGHVPGGPGPLDACRAGMREISHASALLEAVLWRTEQPPADLVAALSELNGPESDALYACMASDGMAFAPNLSMYEPIIAGLAPPQAAMTRRLVGVLGQISLRAHRAGVLIIAATDANGDHEHQQLGAGLHEEMRLLAGAGFTPTEALMAATSNAARHLRSDDIGVIRAGAQADLVLLCADPLADITNSRRIGAVWADGRRVSQTTEC